MSNTTEKARMIALKLADELKIRLSALALAEGTGSAGDPLLTIGAGSIGGANAIVRVIPTAFSLAKDILGNAANSYTPHTIQLCTEANPAGGSGADILTPQQVVSLTSAIDGFGATWEWYQSANGTAPTEAAMIAGNLKATFDQNSYYKLAGS